MRVKKFRELKEKYDKDFAWDLDAGCFVTREHRRVLVFPPNGRWAKGWLVLMPSTRKQHTMYFPKHPTYSDGHTSMAFGIAAKWSRNSKSTKG